MDVIPFGFGSVVSCRSQVGLHRSHTQISRSSFLNPITLQMRGVWALSKLAYSSIILGLWLVQTLSVFTKCLKKMWISFTFSPEKSSLYLIIFLEMSMFHVWFQVKMYAHMLDFLLNGKQRIHRLLPCDSGSFKIRNTQRIKVWKEILQTAEGTVQDDRELVHTAKVREMHAEPLYLQFTPGADFFVTVKRSIFGSAVKSFFRYKNKIAFVNQGI